MKNKHLMEAVDKAVQEIQGHSKEEIEYKLSKSKETNLAKTIDVLVAYSKYISKLAGNNENTK